MSTLLQMKNINKSFNNNRVLTDIQFELQKGEIHALLGENGAGKSTLIKILGGIYSKDSGEIWIDGKLAEINNIADARKFGISIIHQELMLAPHLSISENVFMGREIKKGNGFVDLKRENEETQKLLDRFKIPIRSDAWLDHLTTAQQQMVEIVRATSFGSKIIVMDEPTSSLSEWEVRILFDLIRTLKENNVGVVYISHRLNELEQIADRITILRDGKYISTVSTKETNRSEWIALMVGRELSSYYTKTSTAQEKTVLEVQNLSDGQHVKNVSFTLHKGEILGFAGLVGAGRSETMECLFGLSSRKNGSVQLDGREVNFKNPREAMRNGIGFVPEDRKVEGLFLKQSVGFNISINILKQFLNRFRYSTSTEQTIIDGQIQAVQIRVTGPDQKVGNLSGGNQQKTLICRWLLSSKRIIVLDEPTRGVDVRTKAEIYSLINTLANKGLSIIMVSSELPELINMCDRVVVMSNGVTTGTLNRGEFTQEAIMTLATV